MERKFYNAEFTPAVITKKTDAKGREYFTCRGTIARKDGEVIERTVKLEGKNAPSIRRTMKKGRQIALRGYYDRAPAQGDATRGGEFFVAICRPVAKAA